MDNKVIYLVLVAIVFAILFGLPILGVFYLGVLNPSSMSAAPVSNAAYEKGSTTAMASSIASGTGGYHVYNPLAVGGFIIAFFLGLIIFFWTLVDVRERTKATVPTLLTLLGVIFVFMSLYSFVSGFHDLLTFTKYETTVKPTFGQQYGWFIQFVVYGIIGIALMYAAEHTRKQAGEKKSVLPSVTSPIGAFLLLSTLLLFVTGFHSFLYLTDYTEYRQSLAWVIETFIFGIVSYYMLHVSDKINREEGATKSIFAFPSASLGVIFVLIALGPYLFGSADYVYRVYGQKNLNWLIESAVFGVLGAAFSLLGDDLYRKEGDEGNSFSTSMFLAGAVLLIPAIILFLIGFNEFLYSNTPNMNWLTEFLLLVIPGVLATGSGEYVRRSQKITTPAEKPAKKKAKQAEE